MIITKMLARIFSQPRPLGVGSGSLDETVGSVGISGVGWAGKSLMASV
jgi:hypothetical protein